MVKVVPTYVPHAVLAERNWVSHIRHHTKSRNQFKAENVEKVSMVKHQYRKKKDIIKQEGVRCVSEVVASDQIYFCKTSHTQLTSSCSIIYSSFCIVFHYGHLLHIFSLNQFLDFVWLQMYELQLHSVDTS